MLGCAVCFDHWMSRKGQDIISLDAHFIDAEWTRHNSLHLGLIDCSEDTYGAVLSREGKKILKKSGMADKTCAMVRDDGGNLRTTTIAFGQGVLASGGLRASEPLSCTALGGDPPRMIPCFAHVMNGACNGAVRTTKSYSRYRIIDVGSSLKHMLSVVTYTKKSAKGWLCYSATL